VKNEIDQLSIKSLLSEDVEYLIPMYQRNYAWGEAEITQLIQDIIDYLPNGRVYYIGTLVVDHRSKLRQREVYETIDGQQRMTTLSLLAAYLKNLKDGIAGDCSWYRHPTLRFESRKCSEKTFAAIFEGHPESLAEEDINGAILNGYRLIAKILPQKLKDDKRELLEFADYLFDKVQIMRVKVPRDTDLNHYFEIMNNRGEQLEKHEVLKSRLLEVFADATADNPDYDSINCFQVIWDTCANMERYVQLGFAFEQREAIFDKDWSRLKVADFDELCEVLAGSKEAGSCDLESLDEILKGPSKSTTKGRKDESPERFNTVINFPNFLLHVLRVMPGNQKVALDDKRLLTAFKDGMPGDKDARIAWVKEFAFNLLRCKHFFDRYVIKREFVNNSDGWSLKSFKRNEDGRGYYVNTFGEEDDNGGDNRRTLMLLAAFHVSAPTMVYKHWLNAALSWLFSASKVGPDTYLAYLESVAKSFVFDRYLASGAGAEYFEMIYMNRGICQSTRKTVSEGGMKAKLSFGEIENNLIFNFLDYLLWLKHKNIARVAKYDFTFRSSVEHYYPQNPKQGYDRLPSESLDSFGNLCLISHSKNSTLSNYMPTAKKEYYEKNDLDSIKQFLMMEAKETWDADRIAVHYEEMKGVLLGSLDAQESPALVPLVP